MMIQTAVTVLEGLRPWTHAISTIALPYKLMLTPFCLGMLAARSPRPPTSVKNDGALVERVLTDSIHNVLYFGVLTFFIILWDVRWITAGFLVIETLMLLFDGFQVLTLLVPAPVAIVGVSPAVVIVGLGARLVSFAASAFYIAIMFGAWGPQRGGGGGRGRGRGGP